MNVQSAAPAPTSRRGVSATWWYTSLSAWLFQVFMLLIWMPITLTHPHLSVGASLAIYLGGGAVWLAAGAWLLRSYRAGSGGDSPRRGTWPGRLDLLALGLGAAFAAVCVWLSGAWVIGGAVLIQLLALLRWPHGMRWRGATAATVLLICLALTLNPDRLADADGVSAALGTWTVGFMSVFLPLVTVFSLWWWDVVSALDHARAAAARLAATQERLRVANDVHDLQGHHLQVIALQLELAERLMDRDPAAAAEQVRAARASVDAARQGTRDLALRFRGVPLQDELRNAAELLEASGLRVDLSLPGDVAQAPDAVLGPIVRETTTNALKHGGGRWAQIGLERTPQGWAYRLANDVGGAGAGPHDDVPAGAGSAPGTGTGLTTVRERASEAGGSASITTNGKHFEVRVSIPAREAGA